jgi:hypothetical protein
MNLPYVGAVVQYRGPVSLGRREASESYRGAPSSVWFAAIVTALREDRQQVANTPSGWINAVDLTVFPPNGGVRTVRMVGRLRDGSADDEQLEEDVWRWPPESAR